jgi:hypothetical protein
MEKSKKANSDNLKKENQKRRKDTLPISLLISFFSRKIRRDCCLQIANARHAAGMCEFHILSPNPFSPSVQIGFHQ